MIKYANGVKEVIGSGNQQQKPNGQNPQLKPGPGDVRRVPDSAIAAFILGISAFLLYFTAIPAFILGITSLRKIDKNPELYKGRGYSIAAICIGSIYLLAFAVLIVILLIYLFALFLWASGR